MALFNNKQHPQSKPRTFALSVAIVLAMAFAIVPAAFAAGPFPCLSGTSSNDATRAQFAATGTGSVFVDVKAGDTYVAKNLKVTVKDNSSTLALDGVVAGRAYELTFASAPNGAAECSGAIATVYAKYGDSEQAIGLRTAVDGKWATFVAPQTRIVDGELYKLQSSKATEGDDGTLTFVYKQDDSVSDLNSITGTISYVDQNGKVVRVDKMPNFLASDGTTVSSLVFASVDGKTTAYQVIGLKDGETMKISPESSQTDFVVYVRELAVNDVEGSYDVSIKYVTEPGGKVLFTDTFKVNKTYRYTAPEQFYQKGADGLVKVYKLAESFSDSNPIELEPGKAPEGNAVEVPYKLVESDESVTWTVQLLNGSNGQSNAIAESYTAEVMPGETVTYEAKPMQVGETMFYPAGVPEGQSKTLSYTYGADNLLDTVYYVPAGFDPEPYTVTVQYVNLADNSVIGKATLNADPNAKEDLQITGPEQLSIDGEEYVRLAGQDQPRRHNFYNSTRVYTIYYRNVKDNLLANAVVTHTTVTTVHRTEETVVRVPGATTITTTGTAAGTTAGATAAAPTNATLAQTSPDVSVIQRDTNGSTTIANNAGTDTSAERSVIEDDVTPLASGTESTDSTNNDANAILIAGIIAGIAAAIAILLIVIKRKGSNDGKGGAHNA